MNIKSSAIPADLLEKIKNPDALEGEDILIEDDNGSLIGVIIQPDAYRFLLQKIGEKEDESDHALYETYDKNSKSLDDLLD